MPRRIARSSPRSPSARRVVACRRRGSSTAPDVSAGSRTVRTQGRFTPPSLTPSSLAGAVRPTTTSEEDIELSRPFPRGGGRCRPHHSQRLESMPGGGYPKFRNDRGVPEICIGVKEFECIGVSPPLDHPHIYINMKEADTILCPYCATRFRFDPRLTPLDADP